MEITPDQIVYWRWAPVVVNATLVFTWATIAFLVFGCWLVTRKVSADVVRSRWQNLLETTVANIRDQIREISQDEPRRYLPFVGTLFLFLAVSNTLTIIPGYQPPAASLSTTAALAACVFVAVPAYGIARQGVVDYLKSYTRPSVIMLPFNIIGELSRTLALAVRLFGNIMSGTLIVGILISLVPLFFPIAMRAFGLLIGLIQAYIFAVLAMVYIASGARSDRKKQATNEARSTGDR